MGGGLIGSCNRLIEIANDLKERYDELGVRDARGMVPVSMYDIFILEAEQLKNNYELALERYAAMQRRLVHTHSNPDYPPAPNPMIQVAGDRANVTNNPGVYFLWRDGIVMYVGMSATSIRGRLTNHDRISKGDWVSWIVMVQSKIEIQYAESYYIGVYRPPLNWPDYNRNPCPSA